MSKKPLPYEVLVIAGIDTIGLARFPHLLYEAGCRVTLLSPPGFAVNRSRFVARHLHTSKKLEESVLHLKEVLSTQTPPFARVIIGDEPTLVAVAKHHGEDWLDGWFPVDHRSNALETILSKHAFYHEMVSAGLYMPFSKLCQGWKEVEEAVKSAGYPIILKAQQGCAGSAVHKVHDSSELEPCYNDLATTEEPLLVQQFCEGALGGSGVLFDHGVPVCWQSSYKYECWPTPLSASSSRIMMQHPDIDHIISELGRITGFHGFASLDWMHETSSDRICLLEMNPRPIPSYHLDQYAGVSFSRSFNQLLSGQRTITPPKPVSQPAPLLRMFPQNLYWGIDNRNLRALILCWGDAPWYDPLLFAAYLRRVLTHYIPKHWRDALKRRG
ncbi:MAG: ATP-grasp domain-containing protein [Methylococcales bacterium]|nr:ATP-grasp domain-containing protein [Methylococcales bacterium]